MFRDCGISITFLKCRTTISLWGALGEVIHCAFHNARRASGGSWADALICIANRRAIDVIAKNLIFIGEGISQNARRGWFHLDEPNVNP